MSMLQSWKTNNKKHFIIQKQVLHILIAGLFYFYFLTGNAFSENLSDIVEISVAGWFSSADANWQISGAIVGGTSISRLEFNDIDSNITTIKGTIKPLPWLAADFYYGWGSIRSGIVIDSDWITDPAGLNRFLWSKSESKTIDDKTKLFAFNFYFNMLKLLHIDKKYNINMNIFLGFMHYRDNIRFTNGVQTIVNEIPVSTPIPGLNSTYDFFWNGFRTGLQAEYQFQRKFFMNTSFALFPYLDYYGEAFWNLRTDLKSTKPNFKHSGSGFLTSGNWGIDFNISLGYKIKKWLSLSTGYNLLYLKVKNGTDITFFADGTSAPALLDEAAIKRHGPFVNLTLSY